MKGYKKNNQDNKKKNIFFFKIFWDVMKLNETNFKHTGGNCPFCKSEQILFDEFHGETYCTECGLIIHTVYARKSIVELIRESQKKEKKETGKKIK